MNKESQLPNCLMWPELVLRRIWFRPLPLLRPTSRHWALRQNVDNVMCNQVQRDWNGRKELINYSWTTTDIIEVSCFHRQYDASNKFIYHGERNEIIILFCKINSVQHGVFFLNDFSVPSWDYFWVHLCGLSNVWHLMYYIYVVEKTSWGSVLT